MQIELTRPLACIDLETTGVDTAEDRVVQIAVVMLSPDGERVSRSRLINPGRPIPAEATEVHGIADEAVANMPTFAQVADSLHGLLSGVDVTGYNVRRFDVPLLSAEFARCGLKWPAGDVQIVDSYEIFRRQEPHKLANALEFYTGEVLGGQAHDAEADATAALDVLLGQSSNYVPRCGGDGDDRVTLGQLNSLARDPDWVDTEGKVIWQGGVACINFGKWMGKPLQQVNRGYFEWVSGQDFGDDFKRICADAAKGAYPRKGDGDDERDGDGSDQDVAGVQPAAGGETVAVRGRHREDRDGTHAPGDRQRSGDTPEAEAPGGGAGSGVQGNLPGAAGEPKRSRPEPGDRASGGRSGATRGPVCGGQAHAGQPSSESTTPDGTHGGGESGRDSEAAGAADPEVKPDKRCVLCISDQRRPKGWTNVAAFTFGGRVHRICWEAYQRMMPLWWKHYHDDDGTRKQLGVDGYTSVLVELGAPPAVEGAGWADSPELRVCEHAWHNCGKLLKMMANARSKG